MNLKQATEISANKILQVKEKATGKLNKMIKTNKFVFGYYLFMIWVFFSAIIFSFRYI